MSVADSAVSRTISLPVTALLKILFKLPVAVLNILKSSMFSKLRANSSVLFHIDGRSGALRSPIKAAVALRKFLPVLANTVLRGINGSTPPARPIVRSSVIPAFLK